MDAQARNVCTAQVAASNESDPFIRSQRQSQVLAYQQSYNRLAAEYNAQADNVFEGSVVNPPDVPRNAPTLDQEMAKVCK